MNNNNEINDYQVLFSDCNELQCYKLRKVRNLVSTIPRNSSAFQLVPGLCALSVRHSVLRQSTRFWSKLIPCESKESPQQARKPVSDCLPGAIGILVVVVL